MGIIKDNNNHKSLIEHIKRAIITNSGKPVEIRDDTLLDKILSEDKPEEPTDEKELLWPPYYHFDDKLRSYFWFVKNPNNLSTFLGEEQINDYKNDYIELKSDKSPSGDDKVSYDKYPHLHAFWRLIKRTFRFCVWLLYVFVGSIFSLFKPNGNFMSLGLGFGSLFLSVIGLAMLVLLGWGLFWLIEKILTCVNNWIVSLYGQQWGGLLWLIPLVLCVVCAVYVVTKICREHKGNTNAPGKDDNNDGNKTDVDNSQSNNNTTECDKSIDDNKDTQKEDDSKANGENVNSSNDKTTECNKNNEGSKQVKKQRWWNKVGKFIDDNELDASRWSKLNAIVLSVVFTSFICCVVYFILFFIHDIIFFQPKMSVPNSGVVKITRPCNVDQYLFLHSSAELWKNTRIGIVEGDEVEVYYSGAFYSTIRDMDKSAVLDEPLKYQVMNSRQYGDEVGNDDIVKYCVYNDESAKIGQLLLQISPTGEEKSQDGKDIINAVDFSNGKKENKFTAKRSGNLYVAVNDVYLDANSLKKMMAPKAIDSTLKNELLNHALYPMTSERLTSQTDELSSKDKDDIKQKFGNDNTKTTLDGLFDINKKIQETHNLIRALVNLNDSAKNKSGKKNDYYDTIVNKYKKQIKEVKKHYKTRNNSCIIDEDHIVFLRGNSKDIKRHNLYAILYGSYVHKRDSLLNQLLSDTALISKLDWEKDADDFWYSDNVGDLLVSVTVYRNLPWYDLSRIYRFIDHQLERVGLALSLLRCLYIVIIVLFAFWIDYRIGKWRYMKQLEELRAAKQKQKST